MDIRSVVQLKFKHIAKCIYNALVQEIKTTISRQGAAVTNESAIRTESWYEVSKKTAARRTRHSTALQAHDNKKHTQFSHARDPVNNQPATKQQLKTTKTSPSPRSFEFLLQCNCGVESDCVLCVIIVHENCLR